MVDSWISSRDLSLRRLLLFCFQRHYTLFREMPRAGNKTSLLKSHFPAELHEESSISDTKVCQFVTLS